MNKKLVLKILMLLILLISSAFSAFVSFIIVDMSYLVLSGLIFTLFIYLLLTINKKINTK